MSKRGERGPQPLPVNHVLAGQADYVGTRTTDQSPLDHGDGLPPSRQFPSDVLAGLSTAQDDILEALKAAPQALVAIDVCESPKQIDSNPNPPPCPAARAFVSTAIPSVMAARRTRVSRAMGFCLMC